VASVFARWQVLPRLLPATISPDLLPTVSSVSSDKGRASKGRSITSVSSVSSVSSDTGRASTGRSITSVSSVSSDKGRASTGVAGKVGVGEGGGRGTSDDDASERCQLCMQAGVGGMGAELGAVMGAELGAEGSSLPPWCRPSSSKHMVIASDCV